VTVEDAVVMYDDHIAGLLSIVRVGREWHWSWHRPDDEIEMGAAKTELAAADAAGRAIVTYYDRAH